MRRSQSQQSVQWRSFWLRRTVLGSVAGAVLFVAISLIILWQSSLRTDGIVILSDNHYLWTYGPTALLVLLVSAWRQLDHQVKASIPWTILQHRPSKVEDGIRLDYVSPLLIVGVSDAIRKKHFVILSSILGFILLKLVTLASTALLDVREVQLTKETDSLIRTSTFEPSRFNQTAFNRDDDSSLVYNAYGLSSYGLEPSSGIFNSLVYETFGSASALDPSIFDLTADVMTIEPAFSCSLASVTINASVDEEAPLTNSSRGRITVDFPECTFTSVEPSFLIDSFYLEREVVPTIQRRGAMSRVRCRDFEALGPNKDFLVLLVLAEIEYSQSYASSEAGGLPEVGQTANITEHSAAIRRSRAIICNPQLRRKKASIRLENVGQSPIVSVRPSDEPAAFLQGFTGDNLTSAFMISMVDAAGLFGVGSADNSRLLEDHPNTMFKMMADSIFHQRADIGVSGYEVLFADDGDDGDDTMITAADAVFGAVSAQIIHKNIRQAVQEPISGFITTVERRLVVSETAMWMMFGGLVLLVLVTIHIFLQRPAPVIPHHPESLIALSQHIPRNEEVSALLSTAEDSDNARTEAMLRRYLFGSSWSAGPLEPRSAFELYCTRLATSDTPLLGPEEQPKPTSDWWQPLMLHPSMVALTLVLPVLVIGALETVFQVAAGRAQNTVALISNDDASTAVFWTRAVPAVVMLLVATLMNSIDFNITLLGPLYMLKRKAHPINEFPDESLVGMLPPRALWKTLKNRIWPVAASITAALIGSVLTIVVSGLFIFEPALRNSDLEIPTSEIFNTTTTSARIDPADAAALVSLLESSDLAYPSNTYEELVFPALGSVQDTGSDPNTTLEANIPAIRAALGCIALPLESSNSSISFNPRILSASVRVSARVELSAECQRGGPSGDLPFLDFSFSQGMAINGTTGFIGKLLSLHLGPYDSILDSAAGETSPNQPDNPPGCPSLALIYGTANPSANTTSITTLVCTQHLESISTHTFMAPTHRILNTTILPQANPTFLPASRALNTTAFPFRIQQSLDQTLSILNQTTFPSTLSLVDPFFKAVLFGRTGLFSGDGRPAGEAAFSSTTDADRRVVFDSIQQFYRRYMAQAVSLSMRQPVPARAAAAARLESGGPAGDEVASVTDPEAVWRMTVHDPSSRLRLVIHWESKLALQGMLGAMVLLMGYAVWGSGGMREVVKANPCEIWGRARLVAGSRLGEEWRRRAREKGDDYDGEKKDWDRIVVKLGWWERESWGGGGRRWGIDVVDEAARPVLRAELGREDGPAAGKSGVARVNERDGWI